MKLRNKETGEIVEVELPIKNGDGWSVSASSLAELNEEWEDYAEPEEQWYIDTIGIASIYHHDNNLSCSEQDFVESKMREIGNWFETREEAEKAVEKLKAWKRLKDNGFKFDGWDENHHNLGIIEFSFDKVENSVWDFEKDLNLLFGGGK